MNISELLSPKDLPVSDTPPANSPQSSPLRRPGRPAQPRTLSGLSQQYSPSHTQAQSLSPPTPSSSSTNALPSIAAHNSAYQASNNNNAAYFQNATSAPSHPISLQPQAAHSPGVVLTPQGLPSSPSFQAQHHLLLQHHQPQAQLIPASGLLSPGRISAARSVAGNSALNTPTSEPRVLPFGVGSDARLTPSQQKPQLQRPGSTASMDTLADLASMQNTPVQNANGARNTSISYTNIQALQRSISARSVSEITMGEAPPAPRVYKAKSLSEDDLRRLSELETQLNTKADDYAAHVEAIGLLHKGFVDHVNATDDASPQDYELLKELRQARARMEHKYPVGEEMWIDWINDERILADSTDARLNLMELCSKSVEDEPSSALLWKNYGDYMYDLWTDALDVDPDRASEWSEEDKLVGREVFTWDAMVSVWQRGVLATQWHLNDSNIVWDRYMEILGQDQERQPSAEKVAHLRSLFENRLIQPHATWDRTFSAFSGFTSTYDNANYEDVMVQIKERCTSAKRQYALREAFEFEVEQAAKNGDKEAEWNGYTAYLEWELNRNGAFSFPLQNALYERATLRFSTDSSIWEDYLELLIKYSDDAVPVLPVLIRATRHCPWSGSLWSHYLLTLEAEGKPFHVLEQVKHQATRTGILDSAGMEELLSIYVAWCGALRRRAFIAGASEDDLDIAEVGIRSALEHVKEIGELRYGKDYAGDPQYRLERIHIKFFTQSQNLEAAREVWQNLIPTHSNTYDFWYRYYIWEMVMWGRLAHINNPQTLPAPRGPTHVLREALKHVDKLDWPESLIQMFENHVEQHENVQELRVCLMDAKKAKKETAKRRAREREEAAKVYAEQQAAAQQAYVEQQAQLAPDQEMEDVDEAASSAKRKREAGDEESVAKRSKQVDNVLPSAEVDVPSAEQGVDTGNQDAPVEAKRDRENSTVVIKNLPIDATETKVRQFFRDCGTVLSITFFPESSSGTLRGVVEFETAEDAQFAQSRDGRRFGENALTVTIGTGTVLWVTNYPPAADEKYIKDLFKQAGDVVDVRFPSLQFNTHRRFCYVQFATPEQALKATELNGKKLEDKYDFVAKISAPRLKHDKQGAAHDGRELYMGHLSFQANERALKELCSAYGKVDSVRIPKNAAGKSRGSGFVVFSSKDEAANAATSLNSTTFMGREIIAQVSDPKSHAVKRVARALYTSASPDPSNATQGTSRASSVSIDHRNGTSESTGADARQRTIALLNVPDTVNDARIHELLRPYGAIRKVVLRPDHQGALVEFADMAGLGAAELALANTGLEISEGRKATLGTYAELKGSKREYNPGKLTAEKPRREKDDVKAAKLPFGNGRVSRPNAHGGRRGGLGLKNSGAGFGGTRAGVGKEGAGDTEMGGTGGGPTTNGDGAEGSAAKGKKTNAEFRAMFLSGKGEKDEKEKENGGAE